MINASIGPEYEIATGSEALENELPQYVQPSSFMFKRTFGSPQVHCTLPMVITPSSSSDYEPHRVEPCLASDVGTPPSSEGERYEVTKTSCQSDTNVSNTTARKLGTVVPEKKEARKNEELLRGCMETAGVHVVSPGIRSMTLPPAPLMLPLTAPLLQQPFPPLERSVLMPPPMRAPIMQHFESFPKTIVGSAEFPSLGSASHHCGLCNPCAHVHSKGCINGIHCRFCHLCPPGELRRRQRAKKAAINATKATGISVSA